ncbi:MAG: metal-dependent transcriptional regulator [Pyrinomonadaceae bacterium MAG19_C2-C3]|nr:metal-dependent transcriptional regulator [Pyrinomonadaceae bacterium MAG19_C2-C3]
MTTAENLAQAVTPVVEDYLKTIYLMRRAHEQVKTVSLAARMKVKPSSVTAMVKALAEMGLVEHEPYYGVHLTANGERIALEVIRHHRLIELYLVEVLGFTWDEVHEEAEVLEHVISEKLEARIAAHLGHPAVDPHGDPIPKLDGTLPDTATRSLADVPERTSARLVRVCDQNAERLRYLAGLGVVPGAEVMVTAIAPFEGPVSVRVGKKIHALDRRLAQTILVED